MTTKTRGSKQEGRREAIFFVGPERKNVFLKEKRCLGFTKRKKGEDLKLGLIKRAKLKPYLPGNGELLSLSFYPCVTNKCTIVTV
jgi:hypothetical protein